MFALIGACQSVVDFGRTESPTIVIIKIKSDV